MLKEELLIRDFRPGDAGEIVRLHGESPDFFEDARINEGFIEAIACRIDYRFFVCEKEDSFLGFCGVLYYVSYGRAEIGPIVVSEEMRRRKVGKQLVDYIFGFLGEQGIRRVTAKVKANNVGAQSFFESLGFGREGYFKEYTMDREDVVQYVKFL